MPEDDQLRLLGAMVDLLLSCTMFVLGGVSLSIVQDRRGGGTMSLGLVVAVMLVFWALDVLLYAAPLVAFTASIGNLLTGRRVIDAATADRLSFRRAIRRYFARRRLLKWFIKSAHREHRRPASLPGGELFGPPEMSVVGHGIASAIIATRQGPVGDLQSVADEAAGSLVVRR